MGKRRNALLVAGQVMLDALGGRLGVPIMVAGYLVFAAFLLGYVSTQVYTNALMEDVAARKRREIAMRERIGVLTARYATMTSKSRVSSVCEEKLGLVESTTSDVVRVVVEGTDIPDESAADEVRVDEVLGSDNNGLTQVMRQ